MTALFYLLAGVFVVFVLVTLAVVSNLASQRRRLGRTLTTYSAKIKYLEEDVSAVRSAEAKLRGKHDLYKHLFQSTKDMIFLFELDPEGLPGRFIEVNAAACSFLGYPREELLAMTPLNVQEFETPVSVLGYTASDLAVLSDDYVHGREKKLASRSARRLAERIVREGTVEFESTFKDRDDRSLPVAIRATRFDMTRNPMIMYTARSIKERLVTEKALQESRQSFAEFFRQSPIGIAIYDADRNLVDVNLACLRMFGAPDRQQFSLLSLFDNSFIPADARSRLRKGESAGYEAVIDFQEILQKSVFATTRTGTAYFDVLITSMGFDEAFRSKGYFAQILDVTERRVAEENLRQSEQQLRQAEKMEALGSMAGGIAHDFNNMLTPIIGYAQMITKKFQEGAEPFESAKKILRAANRAKDLVGQILSFSRKSDGREKLLPIHIVPIAKEVLKLQAATLPPNIEIRRALKEEQDTVLANPTKIHQVLMNLCTNAVYAMKQTGGALELSARNFTASRGSSQEVANLEPGRYLCLSVRDAGTGMSQATLKRIFEPFFTTKPSGEGTGMGLAVVHGIVKALKGGIAVESQPGKGSVFHVALPVVDAPATEEAGRENAELPTGNERILVVDDDAEVIETATDMLKSLGYVTVTARSGKEALDIFMADPGKFHLVISDQVMPGMTGTQLAMSIFAVRRGMPFILCTGFSNMVTPEETTIIGIREYLLKPLTIDKLSLVVRRVLDQGKAAHAPGSEAAAIPSASP